MNRLLLENSNKLVERAPQTLETELVPDWNVNRLFINWETPYKGKDNKKVGLLDYETRRR